MWNNKDQGMLGCVHDIADSMILSQFPYLKGFGNNAKSVWKRLDVSTLTTLVSIVCTVIHRYEQLSIIRYQFQNNERNFQTKNLVPTCFTAIYLGFLGTLSLHVTYCRFNSMYYKQVYMTLECQRSIHIKVVYISLKQLRSVCEFTTAAIFVYSNDRSKTSPHCLIRRLL